MRSAPGFALAALALAACGSDPAPVSADASGDAPFIFVGSDVPSTGDEGVALDSGPADPELPPPPENHPPSFATLDALTLKMGHTTTVELAAAMSDPEDADGALVLSWSSKHVALQDSPVRVLTVVAPTDWHGAEVVTLTVTDLGGLTAKTDLTVTVEEVVLPPPGPPCGEVTFTYVPGKAVTTALVCGAFDDWCKAPEASWAMADADGDGTWTFVHVFEPGTYEYKFLVDGTWIADPANPKTTPEFGNSVLEVPPCE